jgi:hypothetical protein
MAARTLTHAALVMLPLLAVSAAAGQRAETDRQAEDERTLAQFAAAVDDYAALHRRVELLLPPERLFDNAEDLFAAQDALRAAIVEQRPRAQQGDLFTPGVARLLIERLDRTIIEQGHDVADVLADIDRERLARAPKPAVNHRYPWGIGSAMWPTLLRALPPLPPELEYRFSHRDLVLIDMHAGLVVDVLDDALPPPHDEYVHSNRPASPPRVASHRSPGHVAVRDSSRQHETVLVPGRPAARAENVSQGNRG